MKTILSSLMAVMILGSAWCLADEEPAAVAQSVEMYPAAIFAFEERGEGVKDLGAKVSDILFASLAADPNLMLVDRQDIRRVLDEAELNLSGAVTPAQAIQVGQLTGAKILITGSIIEADKTLYLVAKIIGTETTRVLGTSVKGKTSDEIGPLAEELARKVGETVAKDSSKLVAKEVKTEDLIAAVKKSLGDAKRPIVTVQVEERHVGQATIDPAAETELNLFLKECGFEVLDRSASEKQADIIIKGEGFSEFAMRRGNLVSVKARLEIKAIDLATDKLIATDRQTAVVVDLTEQLAGKAALQEAAARIAERILPKLVKK